MWPQSSLLTCVHVVSVICSSLCPCRLSHFFFMSMSSQSTFFVCGNVVSVFFFKVCVHVVTVIYSSLCRHRHLFYFFTMCPRGFSHISSLVLCVLSYTIIVINQLACVLRITSSKLSFTKHIYKMVLFW